MAFSCWRLPVNTPGRKIAHHPKAYSSYTLATSYISYDGTMRNHRSCYLLRVYMSSFHDDGDRSDQDDINDDVIFTVDTITLYKSEPNVEYAQEISFTTAGNSAACGINLEIDEEYLIHLYRYNGQLTGNSCGGTKSWSSVSEAEVETLQDGCDDLCEGECGKFQVETVGNLCTGMDGYGVVADVVVAVRAINSYHKKTF